MGKEYLSVLLVTKCLTTLPLSLSTLSLSSNMFHTYDNTTHPVYDGCQGQQHHGNLLIHKSTVHYFDNHIELLGADQNTVVQQAVNQLRNQGLQSGKRHHVSHPVSKQLHDQNWTL